MPASQPVAEPAQEKPAAPHVAEVQAHVKSRAHHNKIKQSIKAAKAKPAVPKVEANPQPQDQAVKSPENAQHFKAQAKQPMAKKPAAKAAKPVAKLAPKAAAKQAPKAVAKPTSKPAPKKATAKKPVPKAAQPEKTVADKPAAAKPASKPATQQDTKDKKTPSWLFLNSAKGDELCWGIQEIHKLLNSKAPSPKSEFSEKTDQNEQNAKFTNESPKKDNVSNGAKSKSPQAIQAKPGAGAKPRSASVQQNKNKAPQSKPARQSRPAKAQPSNKAAAQKVASPQWKKVIPGWGNEVKVQSGQSKSKTPFGGAEAAPANQSHANTRDLGVKKQFHPEEAHSTLLHFLHQLVRPGVPMPGQPSSDRGLAQNSRHFMNKSEATAKVNTPISAQRNQMKSAGRMRLADTKAAGLNRQQNKNTAAMPYKPPATANEVTTKLPPKPSMASPTSAPKMPTLNKKDENVEATDKDSLGTTSLKIKNGAKNKPAAEQAKLLTDPENHPTHNRKKLLQLVRSCGKMM